MKKIYLQPVTTIVKMVSQPVLFGGSNGDSTLSGGGSQGDLGGEDVVLSRGSSLWDDEE